MILTLPVLLVMAVVLAAAFVRSSLGFGDAVLAMPLLALIIGIKTAAPLVAFMGPAISILILAGNWRRGDWRAAARLVIASFLGIPLGIFLLARLPEEPLRIALGIIIMLYGAFGLLGPSPRPGRERRGVTFLVGFGAGVLGGAYNTNGPPVVIYGMLRDWPPDRFRATLQSYFLPTGLAILAGHGTAGLWTSDVIRLFALSLPGLALGVWAGGKVNRALPHDVFRRAVHVSLVMMGALLIARSLTA